MVDGEEVEEGEGGVLDIPDVFLERFLNKFSASGRVPGSGGVNFLEVRVGVGFELEVNVLAVVALVDSGKFGDVHAERLKGIVGSDGFKCFRNFGLGVGEISGNWQEAAVGELVMVVIFHGRDGGFVGGDDYGFVLLPVFLVLGEVVGVFQEVEDSFVLDGSCVLVGG